MAMRALHISHIAFPALRIGFLLSSAAALGGCLSSLPPATQVSPSPQMRPERFFAGATEGSGRLTFRGREPRAFRVKSEGATEADGTFRLDQTVTYEDGEMSRRTWLIRSLGDGTYSGTLSDAQGEMRGAVDGNLFHLRYLVRQPAIYMEQWLYLESDGHSVANQAQVTVLGVPWATVEERIVRSDAGAGGGSAPVR